MTIVLACLYALRCNFKSVCFLFTILEVLVYFIFYQVKVAWNLGKVGGPVFNGRGKCVGMILQHQDDKVGVVPTESIKHFIQDFDKNGAYTGMFGFLNLRE